MQELDSTRMSDAAIRIGLVLLSHCGLHADIALSWALRARVDLIVGGHSHDVLDKGQLAQGVPIVQAGCNRERLGRVTLDIGDEGVRVVDVRHEVASEDWPADPAVLEELTSCASDLEAWLDEPVAELVDAVDETVKKYFSEEQLADLAERRQQLGEQAISDVEAAWPKLIEQVQAAVDAGLDPDTPEAQRLAAEWMSLLGQFHGGDEGLRESLYRMYADNAEQVEQQRGGPSPALLEFVKAANAART